MVGDSHVRGEIHVGTGHDIQGGVGMGNDGIVHVHGTGKGSHSLIIEIHVQNNPVGAHGVLVGKEVVPVYGGIDDLQVAVIGKGSGTVKDHSGQVYGAVVCEFGYQGDR